MKTYNDIMKVLKPLEQELLQVATYLEPDGSQNCVIIMDNDPTRFVETLKPLSSFARGKRLPYPLIIDRSFLMSSRDSYPLELLNFSHQYTNLYSREDLLKVLSFDKQDMRLQMERELKSKLLLTRMAILEGRKSEGELNRIIRRSILAICPVLKGFLYLSGAGIPSSFDNLLTNCQQILSLNLAILKACLEEKRSTLNTAVDYLALINALLIKLDEISL